MIVIVIEFWSDDLDLILRELIRYRLGIESRRTVGEIDCQIHGLFLIYIDADIKPFGIDKCKLGAVELIVFGVIEYNSFRFKIFGF